MESNQTISWSGKLTFKIIDPKAKLWMLEFHKKSLKDNLKHFQSNYIPHDPYCPKLFNRIKEEMTLKIKKIKSLTRQIRRVKTKL